MKYKKVIVYFWLIIFLIISFRAPWTVSSSSGNVISTKNYPVWSVQNGRYKLDVHAYFFRVFIATVLAGGIFLVGRHSPKNKRVGKEWLLFLKWFLIGFGGWLFVWFIGGDGSIEYYIESLLGMQKDTLMCWVLTLAPYILYQFIRSVRWALKTHGGGGAADPEKENRPPAPL